MVILKTVSIGCSSVHQPVDHVLQRRNSQNKHHDCNYQAQAYLVLCAKNPLADDETLQPEGVEVEGQGFQLGASCELGGISELLLGQLQEEYV